MPSHMKFQAWIKGSGGLLPEYRVNIEGNKVTCFIPSIGGTPFSVHWRDEGSEMFTAGYILVDGVASPGRFLNGLGETHRDGIRSGNQSEIPYMFANIPSTAPFPKPEDNHGIIELKIMLANRGEGRSPNDPDRLTSHREDQLARLGPEYDVVARAPERMCAPQFPKTWAGTPHGGGPPRSYVKFRFVYRPVEWLMKHGIIRYFCITPPKMVVPGYMALEPLDTTAGLRTGDEDEEAEDTEQATGGEVNAHPFSPPPLPTCSKLKGKGKEKETLSGAFGRNMSGFISPETSGHKAEAMGRNMLGQPQGPTTATALQEQLPASAKGKTREKTTRRRAPPGRPTQKQLREEKKKHDEEMHEKYKRGEIKIPQYTIRELLEEHREEFEAAYFEKYGKLPTGAYEGLAKASAIAAKESPSAQNTYIVPSRPGPSVTPGVPCGPLRPATVPMFPIPGRTPSGRPSAIIDTRMFAYPSPAASSQASTPAYSGNLYPQQYDNSMQN
ncbi:uncharacterized protein FOMMEDRAFT_157629 [Fomitiporia mediterranea MF3/22]|uniref:uncharacterized protein n=1 Tax=Fomitiporia mediterranea (strain MF3/22) TaxID=694068 RepID=UPI0004407F80|nr:uncharacterized protein FOMMEDRAFT_157629 [Fomitiporia mediterranea MF3/22]EJD02418.1 hypothetical protein FOMMEDRAFT_157629 [Fomitiporia mediterranea MF3/22]